jgi:hypothetical protein
MLVSETAPSEILKGTIAIKARAANQLLQTFGKQMSPFKVMFLLWDAVLHLDTNRKQALRLFADAVTAALKLSMPLEAGIAAIYLAEMENQIDGRPFWESF